ncbi:MAG TPA: KTSC domain-containing protein [Pyrinomonadaceae bacterium]|jgi:hypothetical protein
MAAAKSTGNKFIPVESEMIVAVRYLPDAQHLDVIFRTGDKYRYLRVPPLEFEGLMSAKSKGQYMHKRILGRFEYERLE